MCVRAYGDKVKIVFPINNEEERRLSSPQKLISLVRSSIFFHVRARFLGMLKPFIREDALRFSNTACLYRCIFKTELHFLVEKERGNNQGHLLSKDRRCQLISLVRSSILFRSRGTVFWARSSARLLEDTSPHRKCGALISLEFQYRGESSLCRILHGCCKQLSANSSYLDQLELAGNEASCLLVALCIRQVGDERLSDRVQFVFWLVPRARESMSERVLTCALLPRSRFRARASFGIAAIGFDLSF